MSEALAAITQQLDALTASFGERFAAAVTEQSLREENAKILGKKGELTAILKGLGQVPADSRKSVGEKVNVVKTLVETSFEEHLKAIHKKLRDADLNAVPFDLTLPSRTPAPLGHAAGGRRPRRLRLLQPGRRLCAA